MGNSIFQTQGTTLPHTQERRRITNCSGTPVSLHIPIAESPEPNSGDSMEIDPKTTSLTVGGYTVRLEDCLYLPKTSGSKEERTLLEQERSTQTLGNYVVHCSSDRHYKILEFAVPTTDQVDYGDLSQFGIHPCNSPTHLKCSQDCQRHRGYSRICRNESSYLIPTICGHFLGNVFHLAPGYRTRHSGVYSYPNNAVLMNGKAELDRVVTTTVGANVVFTNNTYWRVNISNQTQDSLTVVGNDGTTIVGPRSFRECSLVQRIVTMKGLMWPRPTNLTDGVEVESFFDDYAFKVSYANGVTQICVKERMGG